jgi:6-phosphogluconolactonase (cycloisomerase 2 family)
VDKDGYLYWLGGIPSGGITPRDLDVSGDRILVANQDSDRVSLILFDREKKKLRSGGVCIPFKSPTCIRIW